jgi:hypothetical protein
MGQFPPERKSVGIIGTRILGSGWLFPTHRPMKLRDGWGTGLTLFVS